MSHRLRRTIFLSLLFLTCQNLAAEWKKLFDSDVVRSYVTVGNAIVIGSRNGCYRSLDQGKTWEFRPLDPGRSPLSVPIGVNSLTSNNRFIFAATNASIYSSADTGKTWRALGPSPDGLPLYMFNVFAQSNFVLATMAGGGLFRSTDDGANWLYLGPDTHYDYLVYGDTLFAGTMDGIWRSNDRGATWAQCGGFPTYVMAPGLAICAGSLFANAYDRLYRSSDGGATWSILSSGLPLSERHVNGIYGSGSFVYVGLSGQKIYRSSDSGVHWNDVSSGLDVFDRGGTVNRFQKMDNWLLTNIGGSLWNCELETVTAASTAMASNPRLYELHQNYPNPFNPRTAISYQIPSASIVKLSVYDALGRELARLVDEEKPAGSHTVLWNAAGVASGTYFCRVQFCPGSTPLAAPVVQTRKMLLLR